MSGGKGVREWVRVHREAIISILLVVLIFAGLVIIWGGDPSTEEGTMRTGMREGIAATITTETSLIPPISEERDHARDWLAREEWHWAVASRTTTTVRVSRGKTRTVLPNHATTPAPVTSDVWGALARCESGGNPANKSNPTYRGAFQFSYSTWASVGGTGDPADAPYSEQLERAIRLQARSGWGQWPRCSRKLGLR